MKKSAILLKSESLNINNLYFEDIKTAQDYYNFFTNSKIFKWKSDLKNNCEDRSNAVSILLDNWNIPNYKVWIFNGAFLNKKESKLCGNCPNSICWDFHVATVIPYKENGEISFVVIDPATLTKPESISYWAENISCSGTNYYLLTNGDKYLWSKKGLNFSKKTFWSRNEKNFNYTMQGLSGINGKSLTGGIKLLFNKKKIKKTRKEFIKLLNNNPLN